MKQEKQIKVKDRSLNRRSFFKKAGKWLGAVAAIEFGALAFSFLWSGGKIKGKDRKEKYIIAGDINNFPPGSVTPFRNGFFYLSRLEAGGFLAMSLKCTHLGCSVSWHSDEKKFICPCHHSRFDINGNVINPPATRALDLYEVVIENNIVKINISKKLKRKKFIKSQAVYS